MPSRPPRQTTCGRLAIRLRSTSASSSHSWSTGMDTYGIGLPFQRPPSGTSNFLYGVAAIAADEAWTVGSFGGPSSDPRPLVYHWNGSTWMLTRVPFHTPGRTVLVDVSASSPSDLWAVGSTARSDLTDGRQLIDHWDGRAWTIQKVPDASDNPGVLAVSAISSGDVWAVGVHLQIGSGASVPFAEHSSGCS
jgi:hypothetical protein